METLCSLYFALAMALGCGAEKPERTPEPTPTPIIEPTNAEKIRMSSDGRSMWEWKYELMCGCEFVYDPMTPEEIAAREAEEDAPTGGRFIYIDD